MKIEFEFTLNESGEPCIRFRHYERNGSLEMEMMRVFLDQIKKNGLRLRMTNSGIDMSNPSMADSWYEINAGK